MSNQATSIRPTFSQEFTNADCPTCGPKPVEIKEEIKEETPKPTISEEYHLAISYITEAQEALALLKKEIRKGGDFLNKTTNAKAGLAHEKVLITDATRLATREIQYVEEQIGDLFVAVERAVQKKPECSACAVFVSLSDKDWKKKFNECENKCSRCLKRVEKFL
jgi:hypothetical protein